MATPTQATVNEPLYPLLGSEYSYQPNTISLPDTSFTPSLEPIYPFHVQEAVSPLVEEYRKLFPVQSHDLNFDPRSFRHLSQTSARYKFQELGTKPEFTKDELKYLRTYATDCLSGFNPQEINFKHPIHKEIYELCGDLLDKYKDLPLETKIDYFEKAVAELTLACANTDDQAFLEVVAYNPKYELIEIALRTHFFHGLIEGEKAQVKAFFGHHHKLPNNLAQREALLLNLATKNGFYHSPHLYIAPQLLDGIAPTIIQKSLDKASAELPLDKALSSFETLIVDEIKTLQLTNSSQCTWLFEGAVRESLTRTITSKLAEQYKQQFQKTGSINREQMQLDFEKLATFSSGSGRFSPMTLPKIQLLAETFDLPNETMPFVHAKAKVLQERQEALKQFAEPATQPSGIWKLFDFSKAAREKGRTEIELQSQNKMQTLEWAEKIWNDYFFAPTPDAIPSAPPMEPSDLVDPVEVVQSEQTPTLPLEAPIEPTHDIVVQTQDPVIPAPSLTVPVPEIQTVTVIDTPPVITLKPEKEKIRLASYVDIAFPDTFKGNDEESWFFLPPIVKKDVLRHVTTMPDNQGKAEDVARRIFKNKEWEMLTEIQKFSTRLFAPLHTVDADFKAKGEELLDFYYSTKINGNFHIFLQKFRALPIAKEPNFLKYVYEIAKASNVQIASWDNQWAQYHWQETDNLLISLQALEQCLHTQASQA